MNQGIKDKLSNVLATLNGKRGIGIGAGALVAVGVVAALAAGTAAAVDALSLTDVNYPAGTTAVADDSTMDSYKQFPTGDEESSYETTQYAGRLWTDKTVTVPTSDNATVGTTATFNLADSTRDLDPDDNGDVPAGKYEVDKTASGTFLTSISLLSSSLTTELVEPVPLDIVLVLDVSGSMTENPATVYIPRYTDDELNSLPAKLTLPGGTYIYNYRNPGNDPYQNKSGFEGYCYISDTGSDADAVRVPYVNKFTNNTNYLYILTNDEDLIGTEKTCYAKFIDTDGHVTNTTDYQQFTFGYTSLYSRSTRTKLQDLREAADEFVTAISQNNQKLVDEGYSDDYMSQISLVKFSSQYLNNSDTPNYTVGTANNGYTQIMTPLTVYTDANVGQVQSIAQNLQANGSTYADYGLTLAKGVFDGEALVGGQKQPGARPGVQKVVVFFTDGNPKHTKGSSPHDFAGLFAQQTWDAARVLKNDGVVIYSVAVVDGADADDTTMNANIYLNGVSSNYPNATAIDGVDNNNNNIYGTNVGRNVPADLAEEYYMPSALSWNPTLGDRAEAYAATSDTSLVAGKTYYMRTGKGTVADPYVYTAVGSPIEANLGSYFESINYYLTVGGDQTLSDAFEKIMNQISAGGGEDTTTTGRDGNTAVTITDYLGDYMEFKGLDGILYGITADSTKFYAPGTQGAYHEQAQVQRDDASATQSTYTMWPKDPVPSALLSARHVDKDTGEVTVDTTSLNGITVKVTRSTDPKTGDTVTITVPPELIPSLRYAVEQQQDGDNITTTSTRADADPLRIFYSVGPKASTVSSVISQLEDQSLRSEDATNESDRQSSAFKDFMANAAANGEDGIYKLYSNKAPSDPATQGTATVNMTLSDNNPYYYYVDEPLYVIASGTGDSAVYRKATSSDAGTKYVRTRYWTVGDNPTETNAYEEWTGASGTYDSSLYTLDESSGAYTAVTSDPGDDVQLYRKFTSDGDDTYTEYSGKFADWSADNGLYIPNGTARTDAAVTNVSIDKAEDANKTDTAKTSLVSTFEGGNATTATQYLGNNGLLSIPVRGTLAVTKNITAGEGFDLPADPVPSATFTLNLKGKDGADLTEANTYRALIRDAAGHPVDPSTHAAVSSADSVKFYVTNDSTFELRDGETLKVTNLPDGATYTVTEDGQPGYQATVTDNTGVKQEPAERGASASTAPAPTSGDSGSGE